VRVYGQVQGEPVRLLLESQGGPPGVPWSVRVQVDSSKATGLWIATVDSAGNESCWSNEILLRPDLVVSAPNPVRQDTSWYDVAGRKLAARPRRAGVWFYQLPGRLGRKLVLR